MSSASSHSTALTRDDGRADAKYDTATRILPYLDQHLSVPVLDFLISKQIYDEASLRKARYDVISQTKMIDAIVEDYERVFNSKADESFGETRNQVISDIGTTRAACGNLIHIIDRKASEQQQTSSGSSQGSNTKIEISPEDLGRETPRPENIDALYAFGRLSYDIGSYKDAALALHLYRSLSRDDEKNAMALWGRTAALILERAPDVADDFRLLRDAIDTRVRGSQQSLTQRLWISHWIIFQLTIAQTASQRQFLADYLCDSRTLGVIQSYAPYLLRYVAVVAIIHAPHRFLRDVARAIVQEQNNYSDPITQIVSSLYVEYDFATASELLVKCKDVFASDYFLQSPQLRDDFFDHALNLFMDVYSHLYKTVDLAQLRNMLQVDQIYVNRPVSSSSSAHTPAPAMAPEATEEGAEGAVAQAEPAVATLTTADAKFVSLASKVGLLPQKPRNDQDDGDAPEQSSTNNSSSNASVQQTLLAAKTAYIPSQTIAFHQLVRNRAIAIGNRGTQLSQILDRRGAAAVAAAAAAAAGTSTATSTN